MPYTSKSRNDGALPGKAAAAAFQLHRSDAPELWYHNIRCNFVAKMSHMDHNMDHNMDVVTGSLQHDASHDMILIVAYLGRMGCLSLLEPFPSPGSTACPWIQASCNLAIFSAQQTGKQ